MLKIWTMASFAAAILFGAALPCAAATAPKAPYLQCVTYARQASDVAIYGDAWTWWGSAKDRYERGTSPKPGSVLVFKSQGRMTRGHVAVVSQVITERYIQISHANWSPINGRRGQVEEDVNVMDVSEAGDWSRVKVWYGPLNDFGTTVYTTFGFIYPGELDAAPVQVAANAPEDVPADVAQALSPAAGSVSVRSVSVRSVTVSGRANGGKSIASDIDQAVQAETPTPADMRAPS